MARRSNYHAPATKMDCSSEITSPVLAMRKWPKIDTGNPAAMEARINEYFDYCIEMNLRPTVELLTCALGTTKPTLDHWEMKGGWRGQMISEAKSLINGVLSEMAMYNLINPTTVIWFQKNHEGYQDNPKALAQQSSGLDLLPSKEDILKRLPKEDDDEEIEDADYREILTYDDGEES